MNSGRQSQRKFLRGLTSKFGTQSKEFLVSLARRSQKRAVREALIPAQGAILPVGNEYNTFLSEFVQEHWNLERAASVSPSLKRTLDRLAQGKNMSINQ
jgi:hypothetical protein